MAKLLLTSSQVSVLLSSVIILFSTIALFLSGYVIQQRTVQSLQDVLSPRSPSPHAVAPLAAKIEPPQISTQVSKSAFRRLRSDYARLQSFLSLPKHREQYHWDKLAYAQLVRDHSEVCNALIIFAELQRTKSPVPRLLLFPRAWVSEHASDTEDRKLEVTRRLLKKASRRFKVVLVPIGPNLGDPADGDGGQGMYSLAALFALTDFERVLMLPTPGLVLNSMPLDSILAFYDEESRMAAFPPMDSGQAELQSLLLVRPSVEAYRESLSNLTTAADDLALFSNLAAPLLSGESEALPSASIFTTAYDLRTASPPFHAQNFSAVMAFIRMVDPELPGPQFDVPYQDIVKARPKDADQGFIWERMYSRYKDARYSVCGLDLEQWRPNHKVDGNGPSIEL